MLIGALADPDDDVRNRAFSVLAEFGASVVGKLEAALANPQAQIRAGAAAALGEIGAAAAPTIPALRSLLDGR